MHIISQCNSGHANRSMFEDNKRGGALLVGGKLSDQSVRVRCKVEGKIEQPHTVFKAAS